MKKELIIRRSTSIHASPGEVWDALTNPTLTKKYMFNCTVSSDWKVGHPITWQGNYEGYEAFQKGTIMKYIPGTILQYSTFDPNYGMHDKPENYLHITYELIDKNGATELLTTIENFSGDEKRYDHTAEMWDNMVIPKLKTLLEKKMQLQ